MDIKLNAERSLLKTIEENNLINENEHIVIGLSGGPDSLCLFSFLYELKDELNLSLSVVHINHCMRPVYADRDQEYVEELCKEWGVECTALVYDCPAIAQREGISSEEAGRQVRYEAFDEACERAVKERGLARAQIKIAVAQNMDDQAETMLFRLMRGTGPDGLAAIRYSRKSEKGFEIIRPLLGTERRHIEEYCEAKRLNPCRDHTNEEAVYTRNKIRLELIPFMEENFNPEVKKSLVRMGELIAEDREFIYGHVEKITQKAGIGSGGNMITISCDEIAKVHRAAGSRVIISLLKKIGLTEDVTKAHIDGILKSIDRGDNTGEMNLPGGYTAEIAYGMLILKKKGAEAEAYGPEQLNFTVKTCNREEFETFRKGAKKNYAAFDLDKLREATGAAEHIEMRHRKSGDFIRLKNGRKKLQDFFVDSKIPRAFREQVLVFAAGSEVLWIAGRDNLISAGFENGIEDYLPQRGRYSGHYLITETTKAVISVEINKNL